MPNETDIIHGTLSGGGGVSPAPETHEDVSYPPELELPTEFRLAEASDVHRYVGLRAERAALRATADRLERQGDSSEAAAAYAELFRLALATTSDYDEALDAAQRSLELKFDKDLSGELVTLLARCGNWQAAVDVSSKANQSVGLDGSARRRLAAHAFRCGDGSRAATELTEIARLEPDATDVLHALGTLSYSLPSQVSRERGILAFHEAARRHRLKGAVLPAFEATLRAFELDPTNLFAAERLAKDLEAQGRREAADEVWRQSADAAHDPTRHDVRATNALSAGDVIAAFAALLDGHADVVFDEQPIVRGIEQLLSPRPGLSHGFDMVLSELGCADWLAVRLELGALLERWSDESSAQVVLARLEAGYFAHLDQAREAYVRAILVQPAQPEARARLTSLTGEGDFSDALLRALVQSARIAQGGLIARQLAAELFERCVHDEGSGNLALWCLERLTHSLFKGEERSSQQERWRVRAERESVDRIRLKEAIATSVGEEQIALLRTLEAKLALEPTETLEHLSVLQMLVERCPNDALWVSRFVEIIDVVAGLVIAPSREERLARALETADRVLGERGRIAHARLLLRHGQIELALGVLRPLVTDTRTTLRGLIWVMSLARRNGDIATAARALDQLAQSFRPAIRAVLEALAAQLYFEVNATDEALRVLSGALRTSQNVARLVTLQVAVADYFEPSSGAEELERALSRVVPNAAVCRVMAKTYRAASELGLAFLWAQRAVTLRPFDLELRRDALSLALDLEDTTKVVESLVGLLEQAQFSSGWEEIAASALAWLAVTARDHAVRLAPQILELAGPANRTVRAALLDTARTVDDETFAIEILERAATAVAAADDRIEILLTLAERRMGRNAIEAGFRALLRAAKASARPESWASFLGTEWAGTSGDASLLRQELVRRSWLPETDRARGLLALRELAVMRFDMAQDTDGAVAAWVEYCQSEGSGGWSVAARDMTQVLGHRATVARLESLARLGRSGVERSSILVLSAQICEEMGDLSKARALVEAAVDQVPNVTFVLPFVERLLGAAVEPTRLEAIYASVERHALGVFGVRALHHRAALSFVRLGEYSQALAHAIAAFETLPDYEDSYRLLVRISKLAFEPQSLTACVMRVAEADSNRSRSVRWLERAYAAIGDSAEELRLKFDLAIRILVGVPRAKAVRTVADCLQAMQSIGLEEVDFLRTRFVRALESLTGELEGPDGARLGIAVASVAIEPLHRVDLFTEAVLSALKADADVDEFVELQRVATAEVASIPFDALRDGLRTVLDQALTWLERPYVAIGEPARSLLARIAVALADATALIRLERRSIQLGHEPWVATFLFEVLNEPAALVGEVGRLLLDVARVWLDAEEVELALGLLDRAVGVPWLRDSLSASATDGGRQLGEPWQAWLNAYCDGLGQWSSSVGVPTLRSRIQALESIVPAVVVSALRVYVERIGGEPRALSSALAELSFSGLGSTQYRADLLVEAAKLAESTYDSEGAIVYYRAACGTYRGHSLARLGLAMLLYRVGRYRSKEQAEYLLELTQELDLVVAEDVVDVAIYVRAQALVALGKRSNAQRLFEEAESKYGPKTFLVLGLAELSAWAEDYASALGYFAAALGGNLRDLRRPAEVALLAARAASAAGDVTLALSWLEPSLNDDTTRPEAITLQAELLGAVDAIVAEGQLALGTVETDQANVGTTLGRIALKREPVGASRDLRPEVEPELDDGEPDTVVVDVEPMSGNAPPARAIATLSVQPDVPEQGWSLPEQSAPESSAPEVSPREGVATTAIASSDLLEQGWSLPEHSLPTTPETESSPSDVRPSEPSADDFAIAIAEELSTDPERQRAWLSDGRRWLRQWPTNTRLVELVRSAAAVEGHHAYVQALTQALGVLRGDAETLEPPDLSEQPVEVDVVRAMLLRDTVSPGVEALELIWDGAEREFVRDPSEYEVTGLMRVVGSASPMARIYSDAARRLGMTRTPLFFRKQPEPLHVRVILLSPPSLLIEGEPFVDERFLSYQLGSSLWATLPPYSLLFGLPKTTVQQVFKALLLAFGSGEGRADRTQGESLRLAQVLWQTIKSRSQRKLKEICLSELSFDNSIERASQSLRRAGLYVSGDLATAIASLTDEQSGVSGAPSARDVLLRAIGSEAGLDLFRFATSAEYADMRWQSVRVNSPVASRPWQ